MSTPAEASARADARAETNTRADARAETSALTQSPASERAEAHASAQAEARASERASERAGTRAARVSERTEAGAEASAGVQALSGLRGRFARHFGDAPAPAPVREEADGPGFIHEVTRWRRIDPAPPLLVGRPLELPDAAGWGAALTWLSRQVDAEIGARPVFLDVEATGLGHGAGTVAFVVGVAALDGDGWRVDQWLLSRLSAEAAMLAALQARLAALGGLLVTYNGASFDLPLLRGRLRRCGLAPEVLGGPHLDLLPIARRLWRGRGPDCRLVTLERLQLGVRRVGDVPGRAIPELFWAALRAPHDARAQAGIRQICAHNLVDVLTMPALGLGLARALAGAGA